MHEEVVTRQDRRIHQYAKETKYQVQPKREKTQSDTVCRYVTAQGLQFTEEMVTKKAFIQALEWKQGKKPPSKANLKFAAELEATTERFVQMAHRVRDHIGIFRKGIVWGESLQEIYREIGEALNESASDIENAVDIAVSMKLLHRQGADSECVTESIYVNPIAA